MIHTLMASSATPQTFTEVGVQAAKVDGANENTARPTAKAVSHARTNLGVFVFDVLMFPPISFGTTSQKTRRIVSSVPFWKTNGERPSSIGCKRAFERVSDFFQLFPGRIYEQDSHTMDEEFLDNWHHKSGLFRRCKQKHS